MKRLFLLPLVGPMRGVSRSFAQFVSHRPLLVVFAAGAIAGLLACADQVLPSEVDEAQAPLLASLPGHVDRAVGEGVIRDPVDPGRNGKPTRFFFNLNDFRTDNDADDFARIRIRNANGTTNPADDVLFFSHDPATLFRTGDKTVVAEAAGTVNGAAGWQCYLVAKDLGTGPRGDDWVEVRLWNPSTGASRFAPQYHFAGRVVKVDRELVVLPSSAIPPVAVDDNYTRLANAPLSVPNGQPGLLDGPTPDDLGVPPAGLRSFRGGPGLPWHLMGSTMTPLPGHTDGSLTVRADGSFDYTPATGSGGTFTFQYRLRQSASAHSDGTVTIRPKSAAGFTITETAGSTATTEAGGTDTFDVVLTSEPTSDVVLTVVSGDVGEATVGAVSLTFTSANWDTAQTVTVTGVDDDVDDGDQVFDVTVSVDDANSDDAFDPLADQTVSVTNTDDDTAGFTITETAGSTATTEAGGTDTFDVVLTSEPTSDVVLTVTSGDVGEATVSAASLTFTALNWNTAQTVTVTGVDDAVDDGDQVFDVTVSVDDANSDDTFDPLADQTVSVTNTDDDTAGFTLTETGGTTAVSETGTTDTFDAVLTRAPLTNVVLDVSSGDTGEATVAPASLTFTPANWNVAQTVTVTGVDDVIVDGDQSTTVTVSVDDLNSDDAFDPLADQTVSVTNTDDDGGDADADLLASQGVNGTDVGWSRGPLPLTESIPVWVLAPAHTESESAVAHMPRHE